MNRNGKTDLILFDLSCRWGFSVIPRGLEKTDLGMYQIFSGVYINKSPAYAVLINLLNRFKRWVPCYGLRISAWWLQTFTPPSS